jgi:hypothetical protein
LETTLPVNNEHFRGVSKARRSSVGDLIECNLLSQQKVSYGCLRFEPGYDKADVRGGSAAGRNELDGWETLKAEFALRRED